MYVFSIMTKTLIWLWLVALKVVIMTTYSATRSSTVTKLATWKLEVFSKFRCMTDSSMNIHEQDEIHDVQWIFRWAMQWTIYCARFSFFLFLVIVILYSRSQGLYTLVCLFVVWHGSFYPYPSGLLHWHWGNHMIAPVSVKQPWRIWVNKSHKPIQNS